MSTPNDPYNQQHPRPLDGEDFLEPIEEQVPASEPGAETFGAQLPEENRPVEAENALDTPIFEDEPADSVAPAYGADGPVADDPAPEPNTTDTATRDEVPYFEAQETAAREAAAPEAVAQQAPAEAGDEARYAAPAQQTAPFEAQADYGHTREYATLGQAAGVPEAPRSQVNEPEAPATSPYRVQEQPYADDSAFAVQYPPVESEAQDRMAQWATIESSEPEVPEEPKGRGWTHVWVTLVTLLLLPVAWYLLSNGMEALRLAHPLTEAELTDPAFNQVTPMVLGPILELLGGVAALIIVALLARRSSFGAQFFGIVIALGAAVGLFFPKLALHVPVLWARVTASLNHVIIDNVTAHLYRDLLWGRFLVFGIVIFVIGLAAHGARKRAAKRAAAQTARELLVSDAE